jgi:hypothetical protein
MPARLNPAVDPVGNATHHGFDRRAELLVRLDLQISEIDTRREPRHVAGQEVDGGAALEGTAVFLGGQR